MSVVGRLDGLRGGGDDGRLCCRLILPLRSEQTKGEEEGEQKLQQLRDGCGTDVMLQRPIGQEQAQTLEGSSGVAAGGTKQQRRMETAA